VYNARSCSETLESVIQSFWDAAAQEQRLMKCLSVRKAVIASAVHCLCYSDKDLDGCLQTFVLDSLQATANCDSQSTITAAAARTCAAF
jgi:hypothetical protein